MRIVLVNWAKVWLGTQRGGGVNGLCQSLALALAERGHEVVSLCSGTTPRLKQRRLIEQTPCHARRHPDWRGVRIYEIVNSPVRAPSTFQFERPEAETSSPELEAVFGDLLARLAPEVVHFHSLEGLSAPCVREARRHARAVLFSLHNYHTICPQVYLTQRSRHVCLSFDNGHACVGCHQPPGRAPSAAAGRGRRARALLPGVPVDELDDPLAPMGLVEPDPRDETAPSGDAGAGRLDPPERTLRLPISNEPRPEPPSDRPPNAYARRRQAMVDVLNACDRVLAVSRFVADKFAALGVHRDRLEVRPIGTRMVELARAMPRAVEPPPPLAANSDRIVRIVFLGYHNPYKGLDFLIEAIEALSARHLARLHLCVHALGVEPIAERIGRLEPRLARLSLTGGYRYEDVPWLLGGADLTIVPSLWWDNAPQTVFESLACGVPVIGADIGGIPDSVRDGENGLLFCAGDLEDLRRKLARAFDEPTLLDRLRAGVRPPKGLQAHLDEMQGLYHELVTGCPRASPRQGSISR